MRVATIALAILITFLAVEPGLDVVCSMVVDVEMNCCDSTCTPFSDDDVAKNQEQDRDCSGKACNPFQVCTSCALLVNEVGSIITISTSRSGLKSKFTYQSAVSSKYISDFWQPPKFV